MTKKLRFSILHRSSSRFMERIGLSGAVIIGVAVVSVVLVACLAPHWLGQAASTESKQRSSADLLPAGQLDSLSPNRSMSLELDKGVASINNILTGIVIDSTTDEGVGGALVQAYSAANPAVCLARGLTKENGSFVLDGVGDSNMSIVAKHPAYEPGHLELNLALSRVGRVTCSLRPYPTILVRFVRGNDDYAAQKLPRMYRIDAGREISHGGGPIELWTTLSNHWVRAAWPPSDSSERDARLVIRSSDFVVDGDIPVHQAAAVAGEELVVAVSEGILIRGVVQDSRGSVRSDSRVCAGYRRKISSMDSRFDEWPSGEGPPGVYYCHGHVNSGPDGKFALRLPSPPDALLVTSETRLLGWVLRPQDSQAVIVLRE